ncbi:Hypothetical protein SRAE_2000322900 [Strongyloides ratti]|uniref:Nucleotide-binding, alpha-beta plait domain-containing protein n=1 Tax=Strongyloides ratti TaxID=34506 RepID=A0A090LK95_STRRB|nr:Hypothetical protein SRAE_2000322900 [Strongyloides ratti]CEF68573.1 Hypothetical protein SRAE_2000322900 [Strongyloides ratti]
MSYGGNRGSSRRDSYDRRDYYDRNRHGGSYQSKHYGNGGGDRRDSSRRDDRRGGHYNGGRNDNGRSNYGGGGRGPAREGNIESFKLFVVDSSVGPCDFMDYLKSKNLKCFYVDCCAPNEFVFASRNSDEVNGVKKHFTSLSGSIQLPLFDDTTKFSLDRNDRSKHENSSNSKRGFTGGDVGNPMKKRRMLDRSDFD